MADDVALCFIFNHPYLKNVPVLRKLYGGLVKHLYFAHPFETDGSDDIFVVYRSSYNFQGYITDVYKSILERSNAKYVIFCGDDVLISPQFLKNTEWITDGGWDGLTTSLWPTKNPNMWKWPHTLRTLARLTITGPYTSHAIENWKRFFPPVEIAEQKLARFGPALDELPEVSDDTISAMHPFNVAGMRVTIESIEKYGWPYPLLNGISDFIVISREKLPQLAHLCGVFSAMGLFVETALPTALALCCDNLQTIGRLGYTYDWSYGLNPATPPIWLQSIEQVEELMESGAPELLYRHPIKLSSVTI